MDSRCQNLSQATFKNVSWLNNLDSSRCLRCTFEKKRYIVYIVKHQSLYHNKVTLSLTPIKRLCNQACKCILYGWTTKPHFDSTLFSNSFVIKVKEIKGFVSHCEAFKRRLNNKTKPGLERDCQKKENCKAICEFNLHIIQLV